MPFREFIVFVYPEFLCLFFLSKTKLYCSGYGFTLDFYVVISSTRKWDMILDLSLDAHPIAQIPFS